MAEACDGNACSVVDKPQKKTRLLIVDDAAEIREALAAYLGRQDFEVNVAASAHEARGVLARFAIDLVILDIMMPGEDGLSLCRDLRARGSLPIIILSARTDDVDRIIGLEMGCDDYVSKPFVPRELLARIRAVLRRTGLHVAVGPASARARYVFASWTLKIDERALIDAQGVTVPMGDAEFRLLQAFVLRPHQVLSRNQLLDMADAREADPFDRSVDNRIMRLRRKLEEDPAVPKLIKTVRSGGYVLAVDVRQVQE
jgi:two-component system OmpR family response regulator